MRCEKFVRNMMVLNKEADQLVSVTNQFDGCLGSGRELKVDEKEV